MKTDELTGKYEVEDSTENALAMIGVIEPRKIIQEVSGFVPVFEAIMEHYKDPITALVFGRRWQFCQMEDGVCRASLKKIAVLLHIDEATVLRHTEKLVSDGYLIDTTPDRRNRPHVYADAGKVVMKSHIRAEKSIAQSNNDVAHSNTGIAQSQLNIPSNRQKNNKKGDFVDAALFYGKQAKEQGEDKVEELLQEMERGLRVNIARSTNNQQVAKRILKDARPFGQWLTWCISDEWRAAHLYLYADLDKVWRDYPQAFDNDTGNNPQGLEVGL